MLDEKAVYKTRWTIERYFDEAAKAADVPYEVSVIEGNILLNEGIAVVLDLAAGIASPTAFNAANAYIGVGDSSTAESAAHTGLQASTNKAYAAMVATYPQRSGQTVTWRAEFGSGVANYAWNEFTVANGNSDASVNLNRKVSAQGTKVSGQVWTMSVAITLA